MPEIEVILKPKIETIKTYKASADEVNMELCHLDIAREAGGPTTKQIIYDLEARINPQEEDDVFVDVRMHRPLPAGHFPGISSFHTDFFPTKTGGAIDWHDLTLNGDLSTIYMYFADVGYTRSLPLIIPTETRFTADEGLTGWKQVRSVLPLTNLWEWPNNTLIKVNGHTLHAPQRAAYAGNRLMIRVAVSKNRKHLNSVNTIPYTVTHGNQDIR